MTDWLLDLPADIKDGGSHIVIAPEGDSTRMANKEHLALLEQGFEVWNQWRTEYEEIMPDLSGASLRKPHLNGFLPLDSQLSVLRAN